MRPETLSVFRRFDQVERGSSIPSAGCRRIANRIAVLRIIAGERRWRAAQMAGLAEIPAVIRDVPDEAAVSMALIENIQREDLNPLEEAGALTRLIEEFGLTHQAAAEAVGRSRAAVSNLLRLMELADEVKELLEQRRIGKMATRAGKAFGWPRAANRSRVGALVVPKIAVGARNRSLGASHH